MSGFNAVNINWCKSELTSGSWLQLSMNFYGPLLFGDMIMLIITEYSQYPVDWLILTAYQLIWGYFMPRG